MRKTIADARKVLKESKASTILQKTIVLDEIDEEDINKKYMNYDYVVVIDVSKK